MIVMIKTKDPHSLLLQRMDSDILRYIIDRDVEPGERIPALSELSDQLNISISKLREQLEVARSLGIVEVRPRTGIRRQDYDFMPALRLSLFFALANDRSMFDLYSNLRVHVEVAYWHEAARQLLPEDISALRQLVNNAWAKLRDSHITIPHSEHRRFHMGIFCRLEHPFVKGILESYWEAYEAVELSRYYDLDYLDKVWKYHERIVDELEAGNYDASLEAFVEHTLLLRHEPNSEPMPSEYYGTMNLKGNRTE